MTQQTTPESGAVTNVELTIGGMTCASCATRIEKKLNKLGGGKPRVNYATEKASLRLRRLQAVSTTPTKTPRVDDGSTTTHPSRVEAAR